MTEQPFPSFAQALRVWFRIGCLSFGGPAGQIALMHREVVDQRRWVSDERFLHALNFCTLLPGPEATQLATYLGWLLHGVKGGLAAGVLFLLPGVLVMLGLSALYAGLGAVPLVAALFFGLKAAVLVLVLEALLRVAKRALQGRLPWAVAVLAFAALFLFNLPFPLVVLAAGLLGYVRPGWFAAGGHGQAAHDTPALLDALLVRDPGRLGRMAPAAWRAGLAALAMWFWPVALLMGLGGEKGRLFADIAWLFSKLAIVTFGGAYAVLAYVTQEAVGHYHWLGADQMLAGLGLAETTPGPLILVLQFVGFMAAFPHGWAAAVGGALLTVWVTFVPCFAWIFLGAPYVERLHDQPRLKGALAGVTAAVVGVIANLGLWFGLRVLFGRQERGWLGLEWPVPGSLDLQALALALLAAVCLFRLKLGVVPTLGAAALAGLGLRLALG